MPNCYTEITGFPGTNAPDIVLRSIDSWNFYHRKIRNEEIGSCLQKNDRMSPRKRKSQGQRIKRDVSGYGGLYPQGSQDP